MVVILGACLYLLMAFSASFVLGTVRALWIAPALGEVATVFIELPIMIGLCWVSCRAAIAWSRPAADASARIAMGVLWLFGLQALEAATALALRGWTLQDWAQSLATPLGAAGLAAMVVCASFPLWQAAKPGAALG